jgi:hypothetical protein
MALRRGANGAQTVTIRATRQALPTVTGFALKCAISALRRSDADPDSLLRRTGLTERDINEPRHRLSATAQADFLEYAALALQDPLYSGSGSPSSRTRARSASCSTSCPRPRMSPRRWRC